MRRRSPEERAAHAARMRAWRAQQSPEARARRLQQKREYGRRVRASFTPEERAAERMATKMRMRAFRAAWTPEQRRDFNALMSARRKMRLLEARLEASDAAAAAARAAVPSLETRFDADDTADVVDVARRHDEVVDLERKVVAARHRVAWITARRTVRALLVAHQQQQSADEDADDQETSATA